jgi:hypothetical protein
VAVTIFASGKAEAAKALRFIEIGTAGTGGAYYPIGIAMAEILSAKLQTQATAQVTGGAVDNIRLIQEGSVKLAITTTASAYRGLKGLEPFKKPSPRVSGLFSNLTQGVYQIAVRENSGIEKLEDLRGKRVSLGPQGGLAVEMSDYVFKAAGFSINDVKATFLSYEESATMMDDGNLDAIIIQSALPSPALRQLQTTGKSFKMISLPATVIDKITQDHPYFATFTIPTAMYNTPTEIITLNSTNMVIVDRDLSEEVVYDILKALMSDVEKIRASHPAARDFALENAVVMPVPLHPGAERYYREQNLIK